MTVLYKARTAVVAGTPLVLVGSGVAGAQPARAAGVRSPGVRFTLDTVELPAPARGAFPQAGGTAPREEEPDDSLPVWRRRP